MNFSLYRVLIGRFLRKCEPIKSEEKAKIEDDQSKVPKLPKPPTLRKVDRTPM